VDIFLEQERRAGVPEIMEGDLGETRAFEERCKGPLTEIGGVDETAALAGEYEP
jgi:hypothetical protein